MMKWRLALLFVFAMLSIGEAQTVDSGRSLNAFLFFSVDVLSLSTVSFSLRTVVGAAYGKLVPKATKSGQYNNICYGFAFAVSELRTPAQAAKYKALGLLSDHSKPKGAKVVIGEGAVPAQNFNSMQEGAFILFKQMGQTLTQCGATANPWEHVAVKGAGTLAYAVNSLGLVSVLPFTAHSANPQINVIDLSQIEPVAGKAGLFQKKGDPTKNVCIYLIDPATIAAPAARFRRTAVRAGKKVEA